MGSLETKFLEFYKYRIKKEFYTKYFRTSCILYKFLILLKISNIDVKNRDEIFDKINVFEQIKITNSFVLAFHFSFLFNF